MPCASVWTWASVPGVTLEETTVPDPLGAAIEVLVSDVWITDCMIVFLRSKKSPYMLSLCISICSSSVSTSDLSTAASSLCPSPVVARGSKSCEASNNEVKSKEEDVLGACEEEGCVHWSYPPPVSLLSSIFTLNVPDVSGGRWGNLKIYSIISGYPSRRHNSVIRIGNGKEVCLCLALITISYSIKTPRSMILWDMIAPRHAALGWRRIDSLWDGIMALLIKPNQKRAAMLKSLFCMGTPTSIHLGVEHRSRKNNIHLNAKKGINENGPTGGHLYCTLSEDTLMECATNNTKPTTCNPYLLAGNHHTTSVEVMAGVNSIKSSIPFTAMLDREDLLTNTFNQKNHPCISKNGNSSTSPFHLDSQTNGARPYSDIVATNGYAGEVHILLFHHWGQTTPTDCLGPLLPNTSSQGGTVSCNRKHGEHGMDAISAPNSTLGTPGTTTPELHEPLYVSNTPKPTLLPNNPSNNEDHESPIRALVTTKTTDDEWRE
ncbi:hypothetical protein H5410_027336 [Solanum commersonii]|uniref:Uncharacterized protein n=1 Tax=Solanum commersonii TaxID=4109 RepID=A0A9J5Z337_SOLCO|nr:hypothetical protein H5410_027336 [Solanum commersonii]